MNNFRTVKELDAVLRQHDAYIPLLQRNYKWSAECAAELAEVLWKKYMTCSNEDYVLNMITLYKDTESHRIQVIDGQQRIVTLNILSSILESDIFKDAYTFERDEQIVSQLSRKLFIDKNLREYKFVSLKLKPLVDIRRFRANAESMLLPVAFSTVYQFYLDCGCNKDAFCQNFDEKVIKSQGWYSDSITRVADLSKLVSIASIYDICRDFGLATRHGSRVENVEDLGDDVSVLRSSKQAEKFQRLWVEAVLKLAAKLFDKPENELPTVVAFRQFLPLELKAGLAEFIKYKVKFLYHLTETEPIEEFLNINRNKTRFVVSDYIRAYMIADKPVTGVPEDVRDENQVVRQQLLELFQKLSSFLYQKKYSQLWEILFEGYDNFSKHPDINRLKILFVDRYVGTNTKSYDFENEYEILTYYRDTIQALIDEMQGPVVTYNTFNAVFMLLKCVPTERFFIIFRNGSAQERQSLLKVIFEEYASIFAHAYLGSRISKASWLSSYLLESQLHADKLTEADLPKLGCNRSEREGWCVRSSATASADINTCLKQLIKEKEDIFNGKGE